MSAGGSRRRVGLLAHATDRLREAILDHGAATTAVVRRAAYDGVAAEPIVAGFVIAVRTHADRISDADIVALQNQGLSDDAIFEVTVAAALGAAQRCLDAGLALLAVSPGR